MQFASSDRLCCNHYQFQSTADMQQSAKDNNNDYYVRLLGNPTAMAYYNLIEDHLLANAIKPLS